MESYKARLKANKRRNEFNKQTYKQFNFRLHIIKDNELIEILNNLPDRNNFFKSAVIEKLERQQNEEK